MANDQNIGSLMSAGYLSYLNDDPGKEWERDLLTAPAGANLYGREQARETLALLWNTGDLTAVSGLTTLSGLTSVSGLASVSGLTAAPEQTATSTLSAVAAGSGDSEDSQPFSAYIGTRPASSRPSQNSAPLRTAGNARTGSGTVSASRSGTGTHKYNTYGSTRTGSEAASASRSGSSAGSATISRSGTVYRTKSGDRQEKSAATLLRVIALLIIMYVLVTIVSFLLIRRSFVSNPVPDFKSFEVPDIEDLPIPDIENFPFPGQ